MSEANATPSSSSFEPAAPPPSGVSIWHWRRWRVLFAWAFAGLIGLLVVAFVYDLQPAVSGSRWSLAWLTRIQFHPLASCPLVRPVNSAQYSHRFDRAEDCSVIYESDATRAEILDRMRTYWLGVGLRPLTPTGEDVVLAGYVDGMHVDVIVHEQNASRNTVVVATSTSSRR